MTKVEYTWENLHMTEFYESYDLIPKVIAY